MNRQVASLQYWLNFVPYTVVFLAVYTLDLTLRFHQSDTFLYLFIGLNTLFSLYMLFILFRIKRYGWIAYFLLPILSLSAAIYIFKTGNRSGPVSIGIPAILEVVMLCHYYFYCYLLKISIRDWPGV